MVPTRMKKEYKTRTSRIAPAFCPFCFKMLDATTSLGSEEVPQPGDFTVCIACCGVLRFTDDMSLLPSSLLEIPTHSRLEFAKAVQACKELPSRQPAHRT
jgi:hypothetical protein